MQKDRYMTFSDLGLHPSILKAIAKQHFETPTPIQEQTIPLVLENEDVIGIAQTGTGKTAAFALPIIQQLLKEQDSAKRSKKIKALVVSPTRELAQQIADNFRLYARFTNMRTAVIFGGTSTEPQKEVLAKGIDILVATPGRLLDLHKQDCINLTSVETLVLDEADLMLDMGFIDDVRKIERLCPKDKQILLFSATMPIKVKDLANTILNSPQKVEVAPHNVGAKSVTQHLYYVPKRKKMELCLHLLRNEIKGDILIFRRTKFGVDKLEKTLQKNNYEVTSLHGDKSQTARDAALKAFKEKQVKILIATDVAARGIDIHALDAVINFDMPNVPEIYVHRIGRTGRAQKSGNAYSFCGADEKNYITPIEQLLGKKIPVEEHPYPLDPKEKPIIHKSKNKSKHKPGRKSAASKKKKRRWY